jgi:hypothetical protein
VRVPLAASVVALALLVAGCGDDDAETSSADEYRTDLNAACQTLEEALTGLPEEQSEEELDLQEVGARAESYGAAFEEEVASLDPPEEFQQAHAEIIRVNELSAPSAEDTEGLLPVFDEIGADHCTTLVETSTRGLELESP